MLCGQIRPLHLCRQLISIPSQTIFKSGKVRRRVNLTEIQWAISSEGKYLELEKAIKHFLNYIYCSTHQSFSPNSPECLGIA